LLSSSPTLGRTWAGYTNSPVRGRRTCTGRPVLGRAEP
jgi:hypothetical protein